MPFLPESEYWRLLRLYTSTYCDILRAQLHIELSTIEHACNINRRQAIRSLGGLQ